jgi:hypothetical protein
MCTFLSHAGPSKGLCMRLLLLLWFLALVWFGNHSARSMHAPAFSAINFKKSREISFKI